MVVCGGLWWLVVVHLIWSGQWYSRRPRSRSGRTVQPSAVAADKRWECLRSWWSVVVLGGSHGGTHGGSHGGTA